MTNRSDIAADQMAGLLQWRDDHDLDDVDLDLLITALTHGSYAFENPPSPDNERLEFLGDSILGSVMAHYFFETCPEDSEGALSKKKARAVSRALLGKVAQELDFGSFILLGKGEEQTGGRRRSSLLGSALEALIGAVYLSRGYDDTVRFIHDHVLKRLLAHIAVNAEWDYKSRLQEYVQQVHQATPVYEILEISGPDHDRSYRVRVTFGAESFPDQVASRKKVAENKAAKAAWDIIAARAESR